MPITNTLSLSLAIALILCGMLVCEAQAKDAIPARQPAPSVTAELVNCAVKEGWCSKNPSVMIIGEDPLYSIIAIVGSRNGIDFHCDGNSCSVPLTLGANNLTFWSVSSFGDTSEKKTIAIRLTATLSRSAISRENTAFVENLPSMQRTLSVDIDKVEKNDEKTARTKKGIEFKAGSDQMAGTNRRMKNAESAFIPVIPSPITENSIPFIGEEKSARISNIHLLIILTRGSLSSFLNYSNELLVDSANSIDSSKAVSPGIAVTKFSIERTHKVSAYIFSHILNRDKGKQRNPVIHSKSEELTAVLDINPPQLIIEDQQSISGRISFEGYASDGVSGITSLMINLGAGWLPAKFENNRWTFSWDTEKAGISGGVYNLQVRASDLAGNEIMRSQKITVINRIWPVLTLYALLLALGFTVAVDPRCKVWKELVQITRRSLALQKMNHPEEKK